MQWEYRQLVVGPGSRSEKYDTGIMSHYWMDDTGLHGELQSIAVKITVKDQRGRDSEFALVDYFAAEEIEALGDQGWELTGVASSEPGSSVYRLFFKRPK